MLMQNESDAAIPVPGVAELLAEQVRLCSAFVLRPPVLYAATPFLPLAPRSNLLLMELWRRFYP